MGATAVAAATTYLAISLSDSFSGFTAFPDSEVPAVASMGDAGPAVEEAFSPSTEVRAEGSVESSTDVFWPRRRLPGALPEAGGAGFGAVAMRAVSVGANQNPAEQDRRRSTQVGEGWSYFHKMG